MERRNVSPEKKIIFLINMYMLAFFKNGKKAARAQAGYFGCLLPDGRREQCRKLMFTSK
jgi:hypothetical protein